VLAVDNASVRLARSHVHTGFTERLPGGSGSRVPPGPRVRVSGSPGHHPNGHDPADTERAPGRRGSPGLLLAVRRHRLPPEARSTGTDPGTGRVSVAGGSNFRHRNGPSERLR